MGYGVTTPTRGVSEPPATEVHWIDPVSRRHTVASTWFDAREKLGRDTLPERLHFLNVGEYVP